MNSTSLSWLLSARSYLFIPGDRPDRFDRAWDGPADALILDLEDAVFPERKDFARLEVQKWLDQSKPVWIRINAMGSKWFDEDVQLLSLRMADRTEFGRDKLKQAPAALLRTGGAKSWD